MTHPFTADQLRAEFIYCPLTGVFARKIKRVHNSNMGDIPRQLEPHGYLTISVLGKKCYAHRLAWLYVTGNWPMSRLDHKNGDRADNRFDNLREATHQQNSINRPAKGTRFHPRLGRWTAQIGVNMKQIYLGAFDTKEAAHEAYIFAIVKYHSPEWLTRKGA